MPDDLDQLARDLIGCFPVLDKSDRSAADAWPGPTEFAAWARRVQAVIEAAKAWRDAIRDAPDDDDLSWADDPYLTIAHSLYAAVDALEAPS